MGLEDYQAKRAFDQTPEPKGKKRRNQGDLKFVIQKHRASRLHYDFRLELGGVLVSWAVPKGPSTDPEDRRLAMKVEDHPYDYRTFEGVIPKGNYGAGNVIVWDEGTYWDYNHSPRGTAERKLKQMLDEGHITFILNGHKLKGEYALIKIRDDDSKGDNAWMLIKKGDDYASKSDITLQDRSVVSGHTVESVAKESPAGSQPSLAEAPKAPMPTQVQPMLATLTDAPFEREGWIYEVKWDGYRILSQVEGGKPDLRSRNHQSYTAKFAPIAKELSSLNHDVILDGEVVVLNDEGKSSFQLLQNYQRTGQGNLVYYVFDLLFLDGHDLRDLPLVDRKELLKTMLPPSLRVKYSDHVEKRGIDFFKAAAQQGLEGIMAKEASSKYVSQRSKSWLKIKTKMRQEAVIGGYTEPRGSRKGIGALVLGVYKSSDLIYIGHTGGGLGNDKALQELHDTLAALETDTSPFAASFKVNAPVHWVKPHLVCEIEFAEWTEDGHMRQPIFIGMRQDKEPKDVKKEEVMSTPAPSKKPQTARKLDDKLKLTHLDKIYWPNDGYTKGDLINYYKQMGPLMMPYLKNRPQNMNRHPNGIEDASFYQKDVDHKLPEWIETMEVYSESNQKNINYLVCNDMDTLLYMANLGCIEINPWLSRTHKLEHPDYCVIDLDPEGIGFDEVIKAAQEVHKVLDKLGVEGYPKTSGSTGLHIYIPLAAKYTFEQSKQFAHIIATLVNQQLPDTTSIERSPSKRPNRIYLDYLQNRYGQTLAAPYCVRPKPGATVSTPLEWSEVRKGLHPSQFTIKNIQKRVEKKGDMWKPVLGKGINLEKALKALE